MVDFQGRKAQRCSAGACVYVDRRADMVYISDEPDKEARTILELPPDRFDVFLDEVTGDLPTGANGVISTHTSDSGVIVSDKFDNSLTFDLQEWSAFTVGAADGDFSPARFLIDAGKLR